LVNTETVEDGKRIVYTFTIAAKIDYTVVPQEKGQFDVSRCCPVSSLTDQLAAAKAAYAASPTAANKAIAVGLVRQVAAAKKAAEPKLDLQALAQQAKAAQAKREQASQGRRWLLIEPSACMKRRANIPGVASHGHFGPKEEAAMALLIKTAREQL
jgi:phage protein D